MSCLCTWWGPVHDGDVGATMTITLDRVEPGISGRRLPAPRKPVDVAATPADPEPGHAGRRWLMLPLVALLVWFVVDSRATIAAGFAGLADASPGWLLVAAAGGAALTLAAAVAQNGALETKIPLGTMCAVQLAASLVNQLLPAGTGAMAVTVRFLRRRGLSRAAAAAAMGLNQIAGVIIHLSLLATVLVVEPSTVKLPQPSVEAVVVGLLLAVLVGLGIAAVRRMPRRLRAGRPEQPGPADRMRAEFDRLRVVMRDPRRAAALWLGSLATPLLQAVVLWAVVHSVGANLSLWHVTAVYLAASTLAAVVPTPGGLGTQDVAIAAMLMAAGMPTANAATATVAFRLMTNWLPLLPAGLSLVMLSRRRLI